jgi:hypothetical protein
MRRRFSAVLGRAEIIMSYSNMRGSDYLLQENKIKAFFTSANRCRERIV